MRIAVVGAAGQLGRELTAALPRYDLQAVGLDRSEIDITDPSGVQACLDRARPDAVVNCAAYNLVDLAETERAAAWQVNAVGPANLATACLRLDVPLVHVSTDYVFGADAARTTPYVETDDPQPTSCYGRSKLAGERAVLGAADVNLVVRTCGLYGQPAPGGKGNFVRTMLRLADERKSLAVVRDQRCTPTSAADLAEAIIALIQSHAAGLCHVTNSGDCSWFEFAAEIFRLSGGTVDLQPISTAEFVAKAPRPPYSVLSCERYTAITGNVLRPWQEALADYLDISRLAPRDGPPAE